MSCNNKGFALDNLNKSDETIQAYDKGYRIGFRVRLRNQSKSLLEI